MWFETRQLVFSILMYIFLIFVGSLELRSTLFEGYALLKNKDDFPIQSLKKMDVVLRLFIIRAYFGQETIQDVQDMDFPSGFRVAVSILFSILIFATGTAYFVTSFVEAYNNQWCYLR